MNLLQASIDTPLQNHAASLVEAGQAVWRRGHGDFDHWQSALASLPSAQTTRVDLSDPIIRISAGKPLAGSELQCLRTGLQALHPWRKGPFHVLGVEIDSEWRSDLKWARLQPHLANLSDRLVLDVGCGNGYYALRMLGAGARLVVGIDPTLLFLKQFEAIARFIDGPCPAYLLPLGIEQMPARMGLFDTVFSMGVFYHRRSPFDHLLELRDLLRPGGELVLETLVIEGAPGQVLVPPGRYAKMRNVWFIPSPDTLLTWLERAGFRHARLVDMTPTSEREQRRTDWMQFESLRDFLDPENPGRTLEGHPAPIRGLFLAEK